MQTALQNTKAITSTIVSYLMNNVKILGMKLLGGNSHLFQGGSTFNCSTDVFVFDLNVFLTERVFSTVKN